MLSCREEVGFHQIFREQLGTSWAHGLLVSIDKQQPDSSCPGSSTEKQAGRTAGSREERHRWCSLSGEAGGRNE